MAERCNACGSKLKGFGAVGNQIKSSVLCSSCYEKLGMKISKKYESTKELDEDFNKYIKNAKELNFPEDVINDIELHFKEKRSSIVDYEEVANFLVTTTPNLEGYKIEEYLGIVSDQCVLGTGMFSGWDASVADMFGSESSLYSQKLDQARDTAQKRAVKKTIVLGGNAIVGANLELVTFFNDMIGIIFKGTAVKVKKIEEE